MRRYLPPLCVLLLCLGLVYWIQRTNEGFSLYQISTSLSPSSDYRVVPTAEERERIQIYLSQPFHYLGKGCQFYVFESEDKSCVLKFFKQKHLRPCTLLKKFTWIPWLRLSIQEKIDKQQLRIERLLSSCRLAYEEMRFDTGLIFIHLDHSPALQREVELTDKRGTTYRVALDHHSFLVQERAQTIQEVFSRIDSEAALRIRMEQLVRLVRARCERGIADRDRSFTQNVAFHGSEPRALFIDVGQFYHEATMATEAAIQRDLQKRLYDLCMWAKGAFPCLAPPMESYALALQDTHACDSWDFSKVGASDWDQQSNIEATQLE